MLAASQLLRADLPVPNPNILPDGTKVRVRLEQNLSSKAADEGQTVAFTVTESTKVNDHLVVAEGAAAMGTILESEGSRRMGRSGKLDFSIERVRAVDGQWIPARYNKQKKQGESRTLSTGIITAGVAVAFWPAAPLVLMRKGEDISVNRGTVYEVFTDRNHALVTATPGPTPTPAPKPLPVEVTAAGFATLNVSSPTAGADIEVDGLFVGNTPSVLRLSVGKHEVTVRAGTQVWQKILMLTADSTISLQAQLGNTLSRAAR